MIWWWRWPRLVLAQLILRLFPWQKKKLQEGYRKLNWWSVQSQLGSAVLLFGKFKHEYLFSPLFSQNKKASSGSSCVHVANWYCLIDINYIQVLILLILQTQYADIKGRPPLGTNPVTIPVVAHEHNTSTGPYRRHAAGKQLFLYFTHCSWIQLQFIQVYWLVRWYLYWNNREAKSHVINIWPKEVLIY